MSDCRNKTDENVNTVFMALRLNKNKRKIVGSKQKTDKQQGELSISDINNSRSRLHIVQYEKDRVEAFLKKYHLRAPEARVREVETRANGDDQGETK